MPEAAPAERSQPAPPAALALASRIRPVHVARATAAAAGAIGLTVLLGWAIDAAALTSIVPGFPSMQPWTAVGVLLGALSLWLASFPSRGARAASAASALALVAVAGLPLIEHATGVALGTDLLLFPERVLRTQTARVVPPGRTTLFAAQGLVVMASALLLAPRARGWLGRAAFSFVSTAALAAAGIGVLGYALGLDPLRAMLRGQVASLHTALALAFLAVGTLALRPEVGWVRGMSEAGRSGWAAAGLLGSAALLLAYGAQATLQAGAEAHDATRAALRLAALLSSLKDAETSQRGYLLTGDDAYLQPYETARTRLPGELDGLDEELFEGQSAGVRRIRTLTDEKMAELARTIALRRSGDLPGAIALVETGKGKALMDQILATSDRLASATANAATTARAQELRAAALAALGALGLAGLAFWFVVAAAQARRAAAERAVATAQALGAAEAEARGAERRLHEMQTELAHANRAATMGQLTASIAHEVSQPVAATLSNAQAALRWLRAEPAELEEVREALDRIVRDGKRAAEVIDRVRSLLRKAPSRREAVDINEALQQVIALVQTEAAKDGVAVRTRLDQGLPHIEGDRIQLQQVVLNLMVNAMEAMRAVDGGRRELLISSGRGERGEVLVSVRDSGPGLDPAKLERLFEAFYTTKVGSLGMGLSICRSIVEAHGGRLWAETCEPQGAVFQFTIPRESADDSRGSGARATVKPVR
jgi:signal transduction histidine kinase